MLIYYVAEQIFNQFQGIWETTQIPENKAAIDFWEKVVTRYTGGQFAKSCKIVPKPTPLKHVEKIAKQNKCHLAHLDTFDFQAKDFYLEHGYSVFGVLENAPKGHSRYYMKKDL